MTRPRTPTHILELKGAFKKDPQRKRSGEPRPQTKLGSPPVHLSADEKQAWREIVKQCYPGVLTGMDRAALEVVACAFAQVRNVQEGEQQPSMSARKTVLAMLGKFGLTPRDRDSLSLEILPAPGDFDDC